MSVLQARVLDGPDGTIFDTFHVLPAEQRQAPEPALLAASLARALSGDLSRMLPARRSQPQHLRHFRVAPQLDFAQIAGGTRIGLICTDRPGLLADVARVLREQHLRVHDARIATFGERAEDLLLVSDEHNHPLAPDRCDALRAALLAALDGDKR
jgi:[protein-PII] uridylyltransferase